MSTDEAKTFMESLAQFDLYDPDLQEDPYPFFTEIRETCPVARAETYGGFWLVSRRDDVEFVLMHPEMFSSTEMLIPFYEHPVGRQIPVEIDPPEHTRYRRGLQRFFTPGDANRLSPFIEAECDRLIDPIVAAGECDFVKDFAVPLPTGIFLHLFDLPADQLPAFMAYKDAMLHGGLSNDESMHQQLVEGKNEVAGAFDAVLEKRRSEGCRGDDIVSKVARLGEGDDPWTDEEIIRSLLTLMLGSLDTTTSALGLTFAYLAENPSQRDLLVAEPELIPSAVEELLRYESVPYIARKVVEPCELGGVNLEPGDMVQLLFGAAGRDPRAFENPDEVQFDRANPHQLTFGMGPHRCLGIHQARATLRIALSKWHARIPRYSVAPGTQVTRRLTHVRGVDNFKVAVEA
ncbi:MAG: cytochrome P450 [Acidimicrobiales bacterium]